jgi:hypothetical protein
MGVFGAFFGCSGVVGFNGCFSGARSGDGGFMLACISGCGGVIGCIVAAGGVLCAKKFARRTKNGRKSVVCGVLDEFLRTNRCCAQVL